VEKVSGVLADSSDDAREEGQNLQLCHVNVLVHLNVNVPEHEHQDFRTRARG
jgi:hypothetical protein